MMTPAGLSPLLLPTRGNTKPSTTPQDARCWKQPIGANGLRTVSTKYRDSAAGYTSEPAEIKIQLSTVSAVKH
ncbi:hypothetical protein [Akkermansia muciniphila]|uniref:hypothetical protein n=1 Tax=Akkermansia muciniphila TaxID=239935 RepID=UPI00218086B3|nr:hypothetical protein [Akkermansia muciniphila]